MEPMTLGSPGSPSAGGPTNGSNFLPSFLMGDTNVPSTPRSNTLSPTRGRTQLAFGHSPAGRGAAAASAASPGDFNRSALLQQRSLFGANQPLTPQHGAHNHHHQQQQQLNASISGPPTMGLFDSLKAGDGPPFGTPRSAATGPGGNAGQSAAAAAAAAANFSFNQSYGAFNDSLNTEAYLTQTSDFNVSRLTSPVLGAADFRSPNVVSPRQPTAAFWVTVFGFPPASINAILAHFAQCGSIVDKVLPPNGGNWLHLKYASRVECDKAVNFNERIINNSIMIGVVYCRDADIVDKENQNDAGRSMAANTSVSVNRVRPLAQSAYHSSLSPNEVVLSPPMPQRSTGLVNKAMDMIFGW